jgi:uncharacterized protein (TIGR04255 family)
VAVRFNNPNIEWDYTYFSVFYELVKALGFTKKDEIKPIKLNFRVEPNKHISQAERTEGEAKMVFKNESEDIAIIYSRNYFSLHFLNDYKGWDDFKNLLNKVFEKYQSIHNSSNIASIQMIYINKFNVSRNEKAYNFLNYIPKIEFGEGQELSHIFQSNYRIEPNKILNIKSSIENITSSNEKNIILECNCVSEFSDSFSTWDDLREDAHKYAKKIFESVVTDELKTKIS